MVEKSAGSCQKMPLMATEKWKWSRWQPRRARLATQRSKGVGGRSERSTSREMMHELVKWKDSSMKCSRLIWEGMGVAAGSAARIDGSASPSYTILPLSVRKPCTVKYWQPIKSL